MWQKVGACCVILAIPALWGACAGATFVDAQQKLPCDTTDECPSYEEGTQCIGGYCECPDAGEELCCEPGAGFNECNRHCRPAAECHAELCEAIQDCPSPADSRCGAAVCERGVCRLALRDRLEYQLLGDCKIIKCDTTGKTYVETAESDFFNDGNECTLDRCEGGVSLHLPRTAGVSEESSGRCDGSGNVVECMYDIECGDALSIRCSKRGKCVPEWCTDNNLDTSFGETALDCGGPCDPCPGGQGCNINDDCQDRLCVGGKCAIANCHDKMLNGAETDVDCGAPSCTACEVGKKCDEHATCQSGVCSNGTCVLESCYDGAMNGEESGVDCGADCNPCPLYITPTYK